MLRTPGSTAAARVAAAATARASAAGRVARSNNNSSSSSAAAAAAAAAASASSPSPSASVVRAAVAAAAAAASSSSSSGAAASAAGRRWLNVHEYQSQELMRSYGVNVPDGGVASTGAEAVAMFEKLGAPEEGVVVKAQVLAGGRGLGHFDNGYQHGVHMCKGQAQVYFSAHNMIGAKLITKQTGAGGRPVNHVLVARKHEVKREMYFAILLDRGFGGPVMVGCSEGGMNIEDLAENHPDKIIKIPIKDLDHGPTEAETTQMARALGFDNDAQIADCAQQVKGLWTLFVENDATMIEINPLVEEGSGKVMAFDAKLNFDDNAEFRHPKLFELHDEGQQDPREVAAAKHDLNYIGLDGNIGCLVNGAGLAMATMDIIKLHGGSPANFLDVGGGATKQQVKEAVTILAKDRNVKAILVNIFGGIMRCDVIAKGLIAAVESLDIKIPLIVRLQGTNVNEAKQLIADSGLRIVATDDLDEAANRACEIAADRAAKDPEDDASPAWSLPM